MPNLPPDIHAAAELRAELDEGLAIDPEHDLLPPPGKTKFHIKPSVTPTLFTLSEPELRERLAKMPLETLLCTAWRAKWQATARDKQITPPDDWWTVWLILAGRGWGKTRVGAEDLAWYACSHKAVRCGVISPTSGDLRDVCFEGNSGLLSVIPKQLIRQYNRSFSEITLWNGSLIKGFSAQEADRLRGPQHHRVWCLPAGTQILCPSGHAMPIEELQPGMLVQTRHGPRRVTAAGPSGNPAPLVRLTTDGGTLTATVDHPVLADWRWIEAGKIVHGDRLHRFVRAPGPDRSGRELRGLCRRERVRWIERLPNRPTYNLTVDGEHEYIANGFIVHNCDELASWEKPKDVWDMMMLGLRLGETPQVIVTTTPRPIDLLRELVAQANGDGNVVLTQGSTYDNKANLAPTFFDQIAQYEGTQLGRQELHAEIIDAEESGILKRSWFKLWPADKPLPEFEYVIQSYDTAFTEKTENDPTACTVWGVFKPNDDKPMSVMLLDAWTDHLTYPALKPRVLDDYEALYGDPARRVDLVLVEEKGSGISLLQDLQRAHVFARAYNPGRSDKVQRLHMVSNIILAGRVYIPESQQRAGAPRTWADAFLAQCCSFPLATHDDYVDTLTQALQYLRDSGFLNIDPPAREEYSFADDAPRQRVNPYAV